MKLTVNRAASKPPITSLTLELTVDDARDLIDTISYTNSVIEAKRAGTIVPWYSGRREGRNWAIRKALREALDS